MPHVVCYGQLRGDKSDDVRAIIKEKSYITNNYFCQNSLSNFYLD